MKWIKRVSAALALLIVVIGGAGYLWLRTSLPRIDGEIRLPGLRAPVEIIRDRNAIPHIRARSDHDAYLALGFVHAQDRLFQMEFMRRLGAGRASEIIGARTVAIDRVMRTLGLYRLAEESWRRLSGPTRAALEAYAAGVNAYLETRSGALPPEFMFLAFSPEPWRPADSIVWSRIMAMRLTGNWRTEALRALLAGQLDRARIDELWPMGDTQAPPTMTSSRDDGLFRPPGMQSQLAMILDDWPDVLGPITASNSWGVAGAATTTGKPILANDTHLGYRAPNLFYLARLEAPGLEVSGATVPGVPFTILGHNGRIAWGLTTTESDTQDLFIERLDPANADRYETPEGMRRFESRGETIVVRGADDVAIVIRRSRHGPIVSDAFPSVQGITRPGHVIALAAAALRPDDRTIEAVYHLNQSRDWSSFRNALRKFHSPQQNIVYADVDGNLGLFAPARVPIRKRRNGDMPAPGWTGEYDWDGFIPFDDLPQSYNPSAGRIVNANHPTVSENYPYYLGHGGTPGYRARRIHDLLDAAPRHAPETSAAMQSDRVSMMARDLAPLMTHIKPKQERAQRAVAAIAGWNGEMDRSLAEPLIFTAWLRELNRALYADDLGTAFPHYWRLRPVFVRRALTERTAWCDDITTGQKETCDQILERSLGRALDDLATRYGDDPAEWRWGKAHRAQFSHPLFGQIPVVRELADIAIESDGGGFTLNRGQHWTASESDPFTNRHGPVFRAVYDLSRLDDSRFIQPTGQSGNPLSPSYSNFIERWRDGGYVRIPSARAEALDNAIGILNLVPEK